MSFHHTFPPTIAAQAAFHLTQIEAHDLAALGYWDRYIALQNLYSAHLHEDLRIKWGRLTVAGHDLQAAVTKRWDRERDALMAEAFAEYERALAERVAA